MFRRILVPLDGSALAEQVLPVAARLAHAAEGTMILFMITDPAQDDLSYSLGEALLPPDVGESQDAEKRQYLEQLLQRMHLGEMAAIETLVASGNPAASICAAAEKQRSDLIVIASHGYTGFKQWLLGSVAEKVAHHSPVPVLILRDGEPLSSHRSTDGMTATRVLVPLDVSIHLEEAIVPAARLAVALSSPGKGVLHLMQTVVTQEDATDTEKEAFLQDTKATLDVLGQRVRSDLSRMLVDEGQPKITWSIAVDSDISESIARVAEMGDRTSDALSIESCDLIAMTTHALNSLQKGVTGSVTDRVLHATRLPVLITRPAEIIRRETEQSTRCTRAEVSS